MTDLPFEAEWERLRAERAVVRLRIAHAASAISERARDPLGLKAILRRHPVASAFAGAALASLVVRLFGKRSPPGAEAPPGDAPRPPREGWSSILRDAALGAVLPWLTGFAAAPRDEDGR